MPEVKLGDSLSFKADLTFRIPQGSLLGLLLFTLYTTPLSSMISGHAIPHHLYADDNQLYVSFVSGDCWSTEWFAPILVANKVKNIVQDQLVDLQNPAWKTACLSSLHPCPITPIPFTEIKQRN